MHLPEPLRSELQRLINERVESAVEQTCQPYRDEIQKQIAIESGKTEAKIISQVSYHAQKAQKVNQEKKPFKFDYEQSRQRFASEGIIIAPPSFDTFTPPPLINIIPEAAAERVSSTDEVSEQEPLPDLLPNEFQKAKPSENVHAHLDPISVSLQERVKYGGHITSILEESTANGPFQRQNFELREIGT